MGVWRGMGDTQDIKVYVASVRKYSMILDHEK